MSIVLLIVSPGKRRGYFNRVIPIEHSRKLAESEMTSDNDNTKFPNDLGHFPKPLSKEDRHFLVSSPPFQPCPDTLPKDILPKDTLPKGHLAERHLAERTSCRKDILPKDILPKT